MTTSTQIGFSRDDAFRIKGELEYKVDYLTIDVLKIGPRYVLRFADTGSKSGYTTMTRRSDVDRFFYGGSAANA